ncbi:MAG: DUF3794 and LysM peptidoglycan-binding domain-containing protein [Thermovenabulum sp.]|uniref:DUF3794 and LysM peptidoglycan-binding domain-containing protein n=1 Tax=Thermovenabulum sp. TaxID=3100335 RepID=UPI003C79836F
MGVVLTKEIVRVDQVVGEDKAQAVVEGVINLPAGKPDISRVISVKADVDMESLKISILDGKIMVEGELEVDAMYVANIASQPVHAVEGRIGFNFFAKVPGAKKDMAVKVMPKIEYSKYSFDPQKPREITASFVIQFLVKVLQRVEVEIAVDATGPADLQVLKETVKLDHIVGDAAAQSIAKGDISVPVVKPDILDIVKVQGTARTTQIKVLDNKIIVEGVLDVGVLYVARVPEGQAQQPVHFLEGQIPFTQFVEIPGAKESMTKIVRVEVEHIRGRKKDDRTVAVEAVLKVMVRVYETKVLDVITDLFSPSEKLDVKKVELKIDQVVGENENQIIVKETVMVPDAKPDILEIYSTNATARVDNARIIDGKVIVEGTLLVETLYVAKVPEGQPQQPVHFMEHEIPFTTFVEVPGAEENMMLDFDLIVEHVTASFDPNSPRKMEIRAIIKLFAKVTETVELEVVTEVIEPEEEAPEKPGEKPEEKPSLTIYIVQKGDTLWKIAKRYNVTVESIVKANKLENPNMIMPGQQLIIPR